MKKKKDFIATGFSFFESTMVSWREKKKNPRLDTRLRPFFTRPSNEISFHVGFKFFIALASVAINSSEIMEPIN